MDPLTLADLYQKYSSSLANLQSEENTAKINYQSALDTLRKRRRRDITSLGQNAADRGMVHSGANLQANLDLEGDYNDATGTLGRQHSAALANYAKRKLQEEADFNQTKFMLGLGK